MSYLKISIYINEADQWQHRPLHLELLNALSKNGISGGTVLHAIAGFTLDNVVESTSLFHLGSKLPLVVQFVDTEEKIRPILAEIKTMAANRLVISQEVQVV